MESAQHQLVLVDCHVVAQVIKAQLVVGYIGDVAVVGLLALLRAHAVENNADGEAHEGINLSHPLGITLCQIIIDRNHVNALAVQRIQIDRQRSHQGFAFTGLHLCDASLVQDNAADELNPEGLHVQCSLGALTNRRKSLRKDVVQRLAAGELLLEFGCFPAKLLIRKRLHLRTKRLDFLHDRFNSFQLTFTVASENLIGNF